MNQSRNLNWKAFPSPSLELPQPIHPSLGVPSQTFPYYNAKGQLVCVVCRFVNNEGKKEVRPYSYGGDQRSQGWRWKKPEEPFPLYNLADAMRYRDKDILIVEGEKAANAAKSIFPGHAVLTTMFGANSTEKSDFDVLSGRRVVVFPDHDLAGSAYSKRIAVRAASAGAREIRAVQIPTNFPPKWDLADQLPEGVTIEQINALVLSSPILEPPTAENIEASSTKGFDGHFEAARFLASLSPADSNLKLLAYFRGKHFEYKSGRYVALSDQDMKARVMRYLQTVDLATTRNCNEVIAHINALTLIPEDRNPPLSINKDFESARDLIVLNNGILDVAALFRGEDEFLRPHTPNYFSLCKVPYNFDSEARCPRWESFLEDTIEDPIARQMLQEWFGLNLVYDSRFEKFLLLYGQGANGKSVICVVLRTLLGPEQVSGLTLDSFSRPFQLSHTDGKLANIAEEMNEIDKAAEGALKNFVTGSPTTVERKFGQPYLMIPTARLTFATNVLPRFSDRSDGVWRRMLMLPLHKQILDENKQDKRLIKPEYWIESGEMSGVLNWSLCGLKHLLVRGRFIEPESALISKKDYKLDSNPAAQFLTDFAEYKPGHALSVRELYESYVTWAKSSGYVPLSTGKFCDEVRRKFPDVRRTEHVVTQKSGPRSRNWEGLRLQNESLDSRTSLTSHINLISMNTKGH